jgi:hypothetical protein
VLEGRTSWSLRKHFLASSFPLQTGSTPMTIDDQKEQFSHAYVRTIAAAAGLSASVPEVDDDSIDLILLRRGGGAVYRSPKLEIQLKCADITTLTITAADVHYSLKRKNYDDLRPVNVLVPRILVVMVVPPDLANWANWTAHDLTVRHACHWLSLRGMPNIANPAAQSTTVHVPIANEFSVDALRAIADRIGAGGLP